MSSSVIALENITISYQRRPAVHHVSGQFVSHEATAIFGPNGAGKSTLLKGIAGLLPIQEGNISLHGISQSKIAYLPQASEIDREQPLSVLDLVLTGFWQRRGFWRACNQDDHRKAIQALEAVGLHGFEKRAIMELSGGQFQRVLFARIMVQDTDLILLDEPFNSIDQKTTMDLLKVVQQWQKERRTIIAVLHDEALVKQFFSHTLLLAREVIAWGKTEEVLTQDNLKIALNNVGYWIENPEVCIT